MSKVVEMTVSNSEKHNGDSLDSKLEPTGIDDNQ